MMRAVAMFVVAGFLGGGAAQAQGLPGGPLSSATPPIAPQASGAKPGKKTAPAHLKTAHHAKAPATDAAKAEAPEREVPVAGRANADNPLSLGMKWNGSNDNASQTRVQNYGGDAAGTGAALGLKLHF